MLIAKMPDGTPEIYPAFQGEGATITEHCVFVRLAGCNLSCNFCDTAYTWLWKGGRQSDDYHRYAKKVLRSDYVMEMSVGEVAEKIREAAGKYVTRVIFTGGEPMLQQQDIAKVVDIIDPDDSKIDWIIELETNGTIEIHPDVFPNIDIINCSPKLMSSGNPVAVSNRRGAIKKLKKNVGWYELSFKFVVHHDDIAADMSEIKVWQDEHDIPNDMIYLMPEGITEERIKAGSIEVWEAAYKGGYKFSPRLQIMLWGNKRGV